MALRAARRTYLEFGFAGSSENWILHLKPNSISLSIDTFTVFTFDLEGRPFSAFLEEKNYRCGLDGRVLEKSRPSRGGARVRRRRLLDEDERARFHRRVRDRLNYLDAGQPVVRAESPAGVRTELRGWLNRLLRWDEEALAARARQFRRIYSPVSILPPDQYMALVVQATEGCPWNRCTFCSFYRDRAYHAKSGDELQAHLEAIGTFLGRAIRLQQCIFLGDANLLSMSQERVLDTLARVRRFFSGRVEAPRQTDRFYGFTDIFAARGRSADELRELRREGLRRLYVGLETGNEALRRLLHKPGTAAQAIEGVRAIKEAGIAVGVIAILGLGGADHAADHVRDTTAALCGMGLDAGDLVYFSPLVEAPDGEYERQAQELGFGRLDGAAVEAQRDNMKRGLGPSDRGPRTALYDIREYIY